MIKLELTWDTQDRGSQSARCSVKCVNARSLPASGGILRVLSPPPCLTQVSPMPPLPESLGNSPPLCRWMLCLFKLSHVNPGQSQRCISCTFTWFTLAEWVLAFTLGKRARQKQPADQLWVRRLTGTETEESADSRTPSLVALTTTVRKQRNWRDPTGEDCLPLGQSPWL